jgi:hypothetical protein
MTELPPVAIRNEYWFEIGPADRNLGGILAFGTLGDAEDLRAAYIGVHPDHANVEIRIKHEHMLNSGTNANDPAPLHPFEFTISIGANNFAYAVQTMRELADHLEERGADATNFDLGSGSYNGCHSLLCMRRNVSESDYRKELEDWFERRPKAVMA